MARQCFELALLPKTQSWSLVTRATTDARRMDLINLFISWHDKVPAQIITLNKPATPFIQKRLRYQGGTAEGVAVDTFA